MHDKHGLYHRYGAYAGNIWTGVSPCHITRVCISRRPCILIHLNSLRPAPAADSPVCTAYCACDWLARPRWLTTPQPAHPWLISASPWSSTLRWIITGLAYQVKSIQYILYYILFSLKKRLLWLASSSMQDSNWSISRSTMENLKPTHWVVLKTRGLYGHSSVNVASLKAIIKVPAQRKIPVDKERFRFKIRFKGNLSPTKLWSSQYPV